MSAWPSRCCTCTSGARLIARLPNVWRRSWKRRRCEAGTSRAEIAGAQRRLVEETAHVGLETAVRGALLERPRAVATPPERERGRENCRILGHIRDTRQR